MPHARRVPAPRPPGPRERAAARYEGTLHPEDGRELPAQAVSRASRPLVARHCRAIWIELDIESARGIRARVDPRPRGTGSSRGRYAERRRLPSLVPDAGRGAISGWRSGRPPARAVLGMGVARVDARALRSALEELTKTGCVHGEAEAQLARGASAGLRSTKERSFVRSLRFASEADSIRVGVLEIDSVTRGSELLLTWDVAGAAESRRLRWTSVSDPRSSGVVVPPYGGIEVPVVVRHRIEASVPLVPEADARILASLPGAEPGLVRPLCRELYEVAAEAGAVALR